MMVQIIFYWSLKEKIIFSLTVVQSQTRSKTISLRRSETRSSPIPIRLWSIDAVVIIVPVVADHLLKNKLLPEAGKSCLLLLLIRYSKLLNHTILPFLLLPDSLIFLSHRWMISLINMFRCHQILCPLSWAGMNFISIVMWEINTHSWYSISRIRRSSISWNQERPHFSSNIFLHHPIREKQGQNHYNRYEW